MFFENFFIEKLDLGGEFFLPMPYFDPPKNFRKITLENLSLSDVIRGIKRMC